MSEEQTVEQQIEALVTAEVTGQPIEEPDNEEDQETQDLAEDTTTLDVSEEDQTEEEPPQEINYDQEIPMPDGREPMSLSAMKDRVIALERTEEQIINRENDLMVRTDELKSAIELAGGEISPELKAQMQARQDKHLEREHQAMLEAIPEWKDPSVFNEARQEIANVGKSYGLSSDEISGIMDHRLIKFMHDHARLLKAQTTAKDNLERLKSVPTRKGKKAPISTARSRLNKQADDAIHSNNANDKYAAIDALLKSG